MTPFHLLPEVLSDVDFAPAKAIKPPSKWFNWYLACDGYVFEDDTNPAQATTPWPSHEVAEARALRAIDVRAQNGRWPKGSVKWAGAYPEGQRP